MSPYRSPPKTKRTPLWKFYNDWLAAFGDYECPSPTEQEKATDYAIECRILESIHDSG